MVAQIDQNYLEHGYRKGLRRLVSYGLFEGRPHTTKGQWFNPVVFSILKMCRNIPTGAPVDKPIFITGLGRSGTTILGVLMSLHKDVGFLNEPKAIWSLVDPRHDVNGDYHLSGGVYRLGKADVTAHSKTTAERIFSHYLSTIRASRLVDKYPELIFRIDYLLEVFDDAKVIFISRNGPDAVHSIDAWSKRKGIQRNKEVEDWWGRNDTKWLYIINQLVDSDKDLLPIREVATDDLDHINRAAIEWIITMREGLRQKSAHPDNVYHIKYEDLASSWRTELAALLRFCELDDDSSIFEFASKALYEAPSKPWPDLLPAVEGLFKDTMKRLEYNHTAE